MKIDEISPVDRPGSTLNFLVNGVIDRTSTDPIDVLDSASDTRPSVSETRPSESPVLQAPHGQLATISVAQGPTRPTTQLRLTQGPTLGTQPDSGLRHKLWTWMHQIKQFMQRFLHRAPAKIGGSPLSTPGFLVEWRWARDQARSGSMSFSEARSVISNAKKDRRGAPDRQTWSRLWETHRSDEDLQDDVAQARELFHSFVASTMLTLNNRHDSPVYWSMQLANFLTWALLTQQEADANIVPSNDVLQTRFDAAWLNLHPSREGIWVTYAANRTFAPRMELVDSADSEIRQDARKAMYVLHFALINMRRMLKDPREVFGIERYDLRDYILSLPQWLR